jgi:hypothetical protein
MTALDSGWAFRQLMLVTSLAVAVALFKTVVSIHLRVQGWFDFMRIANEQITAKHDSVRGKYNEIQRHICTG